MLEAIGPLHAKVPIEVFTLQILPTSIQHGFET